MMESSRHYSLKGTGITKPQENDSVQRHIAFMFDKGKSLLPLEQNACILITSANS